MTFDLFAVVVDGGRRRSLEMSRRSAIIASVVVAAAAAAAAAAGAGGAPNDDLSITSMTDVILKSRARHGNALVQPARTGIFICQKNVIWINVSRSFIS